MKVAGLFSALFLMISSITIAQSLSSKMDSMSYSVGLVLAQNIKNDGLKDLNEAVVAAGIADALKEEGMQITLSEAMGIYKEAVTKAKEEKSKVMIEAGKKYLEENGKKAGVVTTASGLQYEVLTSGDGAQPGPTDKVTTHYHGTLTDGTIFDSSVQRGEPISFPVNGVIQGWQEALQMMKVGDKWKLTIPYNLAYGERGAGGVIPPFATLVFEVELLGIN